MARKKLALVETAKEEKMLWGTKPWTHGADVLKTWKRFGFVPPSEYRNDYRFKINREQGDDGLL